MFMFVASEAVNSVQNLGDTFPTPILPIPLPLFSSPPIVPFLTTFSPSSPSQVVMRERCELSQNLS